MDEIYIITFSLTHDRALKIETTCFRFFKNLTFCRLLLSQGWMSTGSGLHSVHPRQVRVPVRVDHSGRKAPVWYVRALYTEWKILNECLIGDYDFFFVKTMHCRDFSYKNTKIISLNSNSI